MPYLNDDARKKAVAHYQKAKTKLYAFRMNLEKDKDIINQLDKQANKNGYVKQLIRDDIKKKG